MSNELIDLGLFLPRLDQLRKEAYYLYLSVYTRRYQDDGTEKDQMGKWAGIFVDLANDVEGMVTKGFVLPDGKRVTIGNQETPLPPLELSDAATRRYAAVWRTAGGNVIWQQSDDFDEANRRYCAAKQNGRHAKLFKRVGDTYQVIMEC